MNVGLRHIRLWQRGAWLIGTALCMMLCCNCTTARSGQGEKRSMSHSVQQQFDSLYLASEYHRLRDDDSTQQRLLEEANALVPDRPEVLYRLGEQYLRADSVSVQQRGEQMVLRAIELMPNEPLFRKTMVEFYNAQGCMEDAKVQCEALVAIRPETEWLGWLVVLYTSPDLQEWDNAIRTIEHIERLEGKDERTVLEKCRCYIAKGDTLGAYNAIEELCNDYPQDTKYRVLKGNYYQEQGHFANARDEYLSVLKVAPQDAVAQYSLLKLYEQVHETELYKEMLWQIVENQEAPHEMKLEAAYGFSRRSMNNSEEMQEAYKVLCRLLRDAQADERTLALYLLFAGQQADTNLEGAAALSHFVETKELDKNSYLLLLEHYVKKNDTDGILYVTEKALKNFPNDAVLHYYHVISCSMLNDDTRLLNALELAWQNVSHEEVSEPASDVFAYYGDMLHEMGSRNEAYEAYEVALKCYPDNYACLNNYAYFLSLEGKDLERAEAMSKKTIEAEPENATYLDTYAWILYQLEHYTQARIYIDQVLQLVKEEADNASLFDHAGDIYWRCGEKAEAVRFWEKAVVLTEEAEQKNIIQKKIKKHQP